ncbi:MAG: sensor histidine kinase [Evtepia gabavorous]
MGVTVVLCAVSAVLGALAGGLWFRRREKRTLQSLDGMLDQAICGEFSPTKFDESLFSAVESRLADYLRPPRCRRGTFRRKRTPSKPSLGTSPTRPRRPLPIFCCMPSCWGAASASQGRDCAAALERQAEKLKTLIEALVKTSRLENGILTFQPVVGPLAPMLEQAVAGLQPKADRKGITLTLLPTQAQARFDPKWTEEAVCNLLDNGVKYTPAGGAVTVSVTAYELFCRIDVTDTGMGLAEEEQAKVFQRFYRAPAARDGEGVGIGLYLVRQIAAGQGGYVKVSSQRGRGSTFSLFLPREGAAASERIFRN